MLRRPINCRIIFIAARCFASAAYAVMRCLCVCVFVCLCVCHVRTFCQNELGLICLRNFYHRRVATPF